MEALGRHRDPRGQTVFRPDALETLLAARKGAAPPHIEVTPEGARRLVEDEKLEDVAALNFASAKNPGGGFLGGARAQEEDLARASALYACLVDQRAYYGANRACRSPLYTDHVIHSRGVPFFPDHALRLLEKPYKVSVLTAPAPNAGALLRRDPDGHARLRAAYERRAGLVLAASAAQGHRTLVLGAWGCGVFRNDPELAAATFARWLDDERFAGAFDRVSFAVLDSTPGARTRSAFEKVFGTSS